MLGHIAMQNAPAIVADEEEAVKHREGDRGNGEEIHRSYSFPMVTKKGEPTLGSIGVPGHPFHPAGNRSFGNVKTEHKKFSMDAGSSPSLVLRHHLANEIPDLFRCPSSPDGLSNFRNHAPVPTESSPVPSDHRFRIDRNQDLFPSGGPEHVRQNPEGLIEYCEPWPGMPSLQRCELLAKSQVLKKQLAPSAEHAPNRSEQKRKQVHHVMLLSHLPCGREGRILLKSQQNRILARDTSTAEFLERG
jgi:hypothetical protein